MGTLDEILTGLEQALELERELGTRTVECDRALLLPPRAATVAASVVPSPVPAVPASAFPSTLRVSAPPREPSSSPAPSSVPSRSPVSAPPDFAFIALRRPEGEAAEMLAKMIGAMGYTPATVLVTTAAEAAQAKARVRVQVVLGSEAFRVFAPGQRAALGLWTTVNDIPTVVTYSPARILSYFRNDQEGLRKAKVQIWGDLKSALARIGKVPPRR